MNTSFELILDDSSPIINYFPFAETLGAPNLLAGWNSYFSQSGFLSQLGEPGLGTSLHVTSLDGAVLTIQWFGTGVALFGNAFEAAYDVSIDGAAPSIGLPRGDVLAEFQGLESKQHLVALIAHPTASTSNTSPFFAFDRAVLNVTTELTGATVSSEFVDDTSSRWFFSGDWTQLSDPILASEPSQTYRVSDTHANAASISFRGSAVSVTGIRNVTNGHYNVTLDGTTTTFDGRSDWLETSTLFLQAGLDETVRHSLTVTNVDDASLAIVGVNVTHVEGGTPITNGSAPTPDPAPARLGTGTIITLVLVGIIGVLAVSTLIACVYFRQRRLRNRKPSLTADGGIRSSVFFRDLGRPWSPKRKPRPAHRSKNSDYGMQDLHTAHSEQPLSPDNDDDDRDRDRSTGNNYPVMLVAQSGHETVDPSSPTPYLRMSRTSPFLVDFPTGEYEGHEQRERSQPTGARESRRNSVGTVVQELLDAHSRPDSGFFDPAMHPPAPLHARAKTPRHRRHSSSVDTGPPQLSRLDIPNQNSAVPTPRSATPQRARRSPLLLVSPLRGSRRTTRRSSLGAGQALSPMQETPASVSTMQFGRPWRESGSGSDQTVTEAAPPPPSKENSVAAELLERLRAHRAQRDERTVPPTPPSTWKPPW